jgi:4-aminobutyrate aminotransferase
MLGVEIVRDHESREKAPKLRDRLIQMAFERGVLLLGAGPNVVRFSPPLVITRDQADFAVDTLAECLRGVSAR